MTDESKVIENLQQWEEEEQQEDKQKPAVVTVAADAKLTDTQEITVPVSDPDNISGVRDTDPTVDEVNTPYPAPDETVAPGSTEAAANWTDTRTDVEVEFVPKGREYGVMAPGHILPECTVEFIKLHEEAQLPTRATDGSVGYDLYVVGDHSIIRGETKVIPAGIALAGDLPPDMEIQLRPRSSTMRKYGIMIANSPGTIDQDYTGEFGIVVWFAPKDLPTAGTFEDTVSIPHGSRIAQLVFCPVFLPECVFVDQAEDRPERGGYGSTGN